MNEYAEVINQIAEKLEIPVAKLLTTIPIIGIKNVFSMCGSVLVLVFSLYQISTIRKKMPQDIEIEDIIYYPSLLTFLIVAGLAIIMICTNAESVFLWFYDKNAWAIYYILDAMQ